MAKKIKSIFKNNSKQPAIIGAISGLGLYTGMMLFAPTVFQNAALAISMALTGLLGASASLFFGFLIPLTALVLASTFLTMGLYSLFAHELPAQKGKEIPRIDIFEGMDIVKNFN